MKILTILAALLLTSIAFSAPSVQEGFRIDDPALDHLELIKKQGELVIDHIHPGSHYEVYGPKGLGEWLKDSKIPHHNIQMDRNDKALANYPTPEQVAASLKQIVQNNTEIMTLSSIGKSKEGRDLWLVKVSDNPTQDEREPEVKYIANMHGDEIVGRELMLNLLQELATQYKQGNPEVRHLINNTEIYILASMNPDGANGRRRGNGAYADLNRDFPDFTTSDNQNSPNGREPETKAVMDLQAERNFSLSANFHGGAEVVNYPWDTTADTHPFENLVIDLSLNYASRVDGMYNSRNFDRGITNGYKWYEVDGGMQDWSYFWHNDLQVTIELSNTKWPSYGDVARYWQKNKASLLGYLTDVHRGAGLYFDSSSESGSVKIFRGNQNLGEYFFNHGEFYKVLPEGSYRFDYNTRSGKSGSLNLNVTTDVDPEDSFRNI